MQLWRCGAPAVSIYSRIHGIKKAIPPAAICGRGFKFIRVASIGMSQTDPGQAPGEYAASL